MEYLYKLCKVWRYTKYHHPDVIVGNINWDAELFRVMPNVLRAKSADEVNIALSYWLKNFPVKVETEQPDVECYQTIDGILSGKDELVEKAIELIQE